MSSADSDSGRAEGARKRIFALEVVTGSIMVLFVLRLFFLQIVKGPEYRKKAQEVAQQVTYIPAQRGEIYDRSNTVPLVINRDSFALDVIPGEIPKDRRETVFAKLAELLGMTIAELKKKIPPGFYHPIEIRDNLAYETIVKVAEHQDEYPGVTWREKPIRNYLETGSISHVLGYVGTITSEELQVLYNKGYQTGAIIGKAGVEKQYDSFLRGKDGKEYKTVDVKGRSVSDTVVRTDPPLPGQNLVLTIDRSIQTLCEKALGERLGAVIVSKPSTGEILAMVSYPWYSPNLFQGASGSKEYQKLLADSNTPLLNRAIQSSYPPASTFKIVMDSAIREEKVFDTAKTIDCKGELDYGDRIFHCWIKKPGHGYQDLSGALAQSCDVYFWTVAKDSLGIERISDYAKEFAFGAVPTGIDLPGELYGFIPTPQWKERRFHEKWLGGDTLNMAIGQGNTLVTPIQMSDMIAMVVNGGAIYKPHVLKEVRDASSGSIIMRIEPELLKRSRISEETFAGVRDDMRDVVTSGTAKYPVNLKSVEVAGKTGTAEVGVTDHWHSWFASFAPYNFKSASEVVSVSVIVEAGNEWEWWAPYATAIIYQGIFANQTYEEVIKTMGFPTHIQTSKERRE